jgi:DNA-binding transcriptional ArsR family regulator
MTVDLDDRVFETTADLFGMLAAPTRLRTVCALVAGERSVGKLLEPVAESRPNMSQQLGTLCRGRVLACRRTGAQTVYRIENKQVHRLCLALKRQRQRGGSMTETSAAGAGR